MDWKPITKEMSRTGPYLVTNNHAARDAYGNMSHVWVTDEIMYDDELEEFICFVGFQKIYGIKLYVKVEPITWEDLPSQGEALG